MWVRKVLGEEKKYLRIAKYLTDDKRVGNAKKRKEERKNKRKAFTMFNVQCVNTDTSKL